MKKLKDQLRNWRSNTQEINEEYRYSATGVLFHDLEELNRFTDEDDTKMV